MRLQLSRPTLWLVAALMAAALSMALSLRGFSWVGDPLWGQETIGIGQVLVLPLLAGAAAVVGWRDAEGILTLLPSPRTRLRHVLTTTAAWALPVTALYCLANLAVVVASARSEPSIHNATPWPVLTQTGGAVLSLVMGYAVGVLSRSWLSAVVAALGTAGVLILDRMGSIATGLAEYAASGTMLAARPNPAYFGMRLLWMGAVGAVVVALVVTGRRHRLGLGLALGATLLVGQVAFASNDSYGIRPDREDQCTTGPVVVCAPHEFRARAERAAVVADRAAKALRELGVAAPDHFVMWQPGRDDSDTLMLVSVGRLRDPVSERDLVSGVVAPSSCGIWRDPDHPPPDSWFYARALVQAWVMMRLTGEPSPAYEHLRARVGPQEALVQLTQAAHALQDCALAEVPPSFGAG